MKTDWTVRWDLESLGDGCRIHFSTAFSAARTCGASAKAGMPSSTSSLAYFDGALDNLLDSWGDARDDAMLHGVSRPREPSAPAWSDGDDRAARAGQ